MTCVKVLPFLSLDVSVSPWRTAHWWPAPDPAVCRSWVVAPSPVYFAPVPYKKQTPHNILLNKYQYYYKFVMYLYYITEHEFNITTHISWYCICRVYLYPKLSRNWSSDSWEDFLEKAPMYDHSSAIRAQWCVLRKIRTNFAQEALFH